MRTFSLLLLLVALSVPVAAQVVPTVKGDRVVGTQPDGKVAWAIQHLSALDQVTGEVRHPIVGPVEFEGSTLYAIRGDLLTLDVGAGRVIHRQQYPALITDLSLEDGQLIVELDIRENRFGETTKIRTPYKAGFVPGRGAWEPFAYVALRTVSDVPASLSDNEKFAKHEGKWTAERAILRMAEDRDPTNPLLPAYRGLAANADGDEAAANTAFAKAIVSAGRWHEQLQVCGVLERAKRPGLAEATCKAAKETMVASGIRPEAMLNLIAYVVVTKDLRLAMEDAVAREDAEAMHRIANYTYETFPNVEAGWMAYMALGDWFTARGDDRGAMWTERANAVMSSPVTRSMWGRARSVDLWILLLSALFFGFPIAGFALGLRRDPDKVRESRWPWMPRPTLLDGLVLAALLISVLPVSMKVMTEVAAIGYFAESPIAALQEGYGSPNVVDWLEQMPESPARDRVLKYGRHELEMAEAGTPVTMTPPEPMDSLLAIEEMANIKGRDDALSFDMTTDSIGEVSVPNAAPFTFPGAFVFLLFALIGRLIRRKVPEIADTLSMLVPGAHAGFFAPVLVTAMFAGGLYLLTPVGKILQSIATPAFGKYFGLGVLDTGATFASAYPIDQVWPWVALVGALGVHAVTVIIARKSTSD